MTQNMTHFNQKELLQKLGLNEREEVIYTALLNKGPLLPQSVAKETGIKRTTLYTIFPEMIKEGFLVEITQGKRCFLQAVSPDKLFDVYEKKYKEIKSEIGELLALYRMQGMKPKVEVYEGLEGIKGVFIDALENEKELLVYNRMYHYDKNLLAWLDDYLRPRIVRVGLDVRAIVTAEKEGFENMPTANYRQTRFVPYEKFPLCIESLIYGNKVCFLTVESGGPLVAVTIESKQITQTQKALFDLAWEGAEKYQK